MTAALIILAAVILLGLGLYYNYFGAKTQCRNCGAYMPKRAEMCPNCGYRIRENYDDPYRH